MTVFFSVLLLENVVICFQSRVVSGLNHSVPMIIEDDDCMQLGPLKILNKKSDYGDQVYLLIGNKSSTYSLERLIEV